MSKKKTEEWLKISAGDPALDVGRTRDKTKVEKAVESLRGMTADEIANMMRECKVKGRPATVRMCPIAVYMRQTWGGTYLVGPKNIIWYSHGRLEKMATPKHWTQFINGYDNGDYPDLVAPPPRVERARPGRKTVKKKRAPYKRSKRINHPALDTGREYAGKPAQGGASDRDKNPS